GHADHRPGPARRQSRSEPGRDPPGHLRHRVPLHRLREHRAGHPLGRRASGYGGGGGMTATESRPTPVPISPAGHPIGFGRLLRKEDARFLRGKGRYLDDIALPGMLHGAILRSPHAHARIVSIDTSAAEAHPKVKAVITGAVLETLGLAWMPTLSHDVQAVLATDKVRFQGQEVAFVVAEDRYAA